MELLKQPLGRPLSLSEQVITLCAANNKVLLDVEPKKIKQFQMDMLQYFKNQHPEIIAAIDDKKVLTDELNQQIIDIAKEYKNK